jgi:ribose 5-phosphate isomerase A
MSGEPNLDACKQAAARKALEYVRDGMVVGLGTGSTARYLLKEIGAKVRLGLKIRGVSTSNDTTELARQCGIPLIETVDSWNIDVAIDGADQVDPALNLIKGGGGALLKEKIIAAAACRLVIMVDYTKRVPALGGSFPLPVEVVPFGWGSTAKQIAELGLKPVLRKRGADPYVTEAGHYIIDVHVPSISDPAALERQLNGIPGVVETGLFVGRTNVLIVGTPAGVEVIEAGR